MNKAHGFIVAVFLLLGGAAVIAGGSYSGGAYDAHGGASSIGGGGVSTMDLDMAGYDIYDTARTTDAASRAGTYQAGNAYPLATGANQTGGNVIVASGIGTAKVTVATAANCATDTLTLTVNGTATVLTEATEWTKTDGNNTATALSLSNAINTALSPAYMTSAAALAVITIVPVPGDVWSLTLATNDATCLTVVDGAEGDVDLYGATIDMNGADLLGLGSDSNTYLHRSAADTWQCVAGGANAWTCNATECDYADAIDMNGQKVYDSTTYLKLGTAAAATDHATGTGGVVVGGQLEVDGTAYFDGSTIHWAPIEVYGTHALAGQAVRVGDATRSSYGGMGFGLDAGINFNVDCSTADKANCNFNFISGANVNKDLDTDTMGTNPTLRVWSATDPDSVNTQWIGIYHDATNGTIQSGLGAVHVFSGLKVSDGTLPSTDHYVAGGAYVEGTSEFDGSVFFDGTAYFDAYPIIRATAGGYGLQIVDAASTSKRYLSLSLEADDGLHISTDPDNSYGNNNIIFTSFANMTKDHDHATPSTNPTMFFHSATDPDTNNTQWLSLSHDQTDGVLDVGTGAVKINDAIKYNPGTTTVADSGADANHATATVTPVGASYHKITCNDDDGCTITLGETGATDGQIVHIVELGSYHSDFSDSAGVSELNGAFEMSQYDVLTLVYVVDTWVEISRSNN